MLEAYLDFIEIIHEYSRINSKCHTLIEANNNISDYRYRKQKKNDKKKSRNFPDELKNREKSFISKIQIYYK